MRDDIDDNEETVNALHGALLRAIAQFAPGQPISANSICIALTLVLSDTLAATRPDETETERLIGLFRETLAASLVTERPVSARFGRA